LVGLRAAGLTSGTAVVTAVRVRRSGGSPLYLTSDGNITSGSNTSSGAYILNGPALDAFVLVPHGRRHRWETRANATAEGGANAGSDFAIIAYDDAGVSIGTPLGITRSTMAALFGGTLAATGGFRNTATQLVMSPTAPTVTSAGTSPSVTANNGTATFRVNVGTGARRRRS
jgi:hypothetical protein